MKTILCRTLPIRSSTVTVANLHTPLEQHSWHLYICPNDNVIQISPQNSIFKVNYMFNKIPCKKERYHLKMEKYKTNSRPAPKKLPSGFPLWNFTELQSHKCPLGTAYLLLLGYQNVTNFALPKSMPGQNAFTGLRKQ